MPIKRYREAPVWFEDPNAPSGWTFQPDEKRAEPTYILPSYSTAAAPPRHVLRQEATMSDPIPSSPEVYDPTIGSDGGGQVGATELPSIDPNDPVEHVDQLRQTPAMASVGQVFPGGVSLVPCPCCGTGVHPDRLRS